MPKFHSEPHETEVAFRKIALLAKVKKLYPKSQFAIVNDSSTKYAKIVQLTSNLTVENRRRIS